MSTAITSSSILINNLKCLSWFWKIGIVVTINIHYIIIKEIYSIQRKEMVEEHSIFLSSWKGSVHFFSWTNEKVAMHLFLGKRWGGKISFEYYDFRNLSLINFQLGWQIAEVISEKWIQIQRLEQAVQMAEVSSSLHLGLNWPLKL